MQQRPGRGSSTACRLLAPSPWRRRSRTGAGITLPDVPDQPSSTRESLQNDLPRHQAGATGLTRPALAGTGTDEFRRVRRSQLMTATTEEDDR
jgi:hypothetical protein